MTEIAKFVMFPRILDFILFISSLGQGFFISWWVNILGPCLLYSKGPFVVRIFGQMAFSPPRPSRWPLLLLFASKAELLPEVCELELAPVLIQILGSDNRVIVIGYSCQISQEVETLEQYFCIQIRSVDRRETGIFYQDNIFLEQRIKLALVHQIWSDMREHLLRLSAASE